MKNTLSNYNILLYATAYKNLDDIFKYIAFAITEPAAAKNQINRIWDAIFKLKVFPYAHQDVIFGKYASKGYKQLLVDNYIVIYKINEEEKQVYVITVLYGGRNA